MQTEKFEADFFSIIVRNVVAPLWAMKERTPYLKHLKYLEESQFRPLNEVREDQWRRFKRLLRHAYDNTEYYFEKMESVGATPDDIRSWDDLHRLPFLTKDNIRADKNRMVAKNISRSKLVSKKTSGSTGVSLELFWDEDSRQWKRACTIRHDRWTGWNLGEKVGAIWGNPGHLRSWRGRLRNLLLERYSYLDTLEMDEEDIADFCHRIKKGRPTLLFGHAHSLYLVARFLNSKGPADIRPKGVISTAMVLHDHERREIEKAFGCSVTNRYGCEEVSLIASECEQHDGLHTNVDTLIVEIVQQGKAVLPGQPGVIVVTDLTNYGMPFIRYAIGDVGVASDRACRCGRTLPLMESLQGRVADYVTTPEGKFVSGISLTENFAMLLSGIKQFQIVQERIDHLVLRIVRAQDFTEVTEHEIARLVKERFGEKMGYSIQYVESIPSERSGKYRFCISKIENPFFTVGGA
ncbi:MAG: phenylacetate--CoA ligase family protein [Candidatus Eisenbacteria bacterium]|nr:phenylacetate--CoA ligase family protein [Candidatus Eisenbacteria bacterium]